MAPQFPFGRVSRAVEKTRWRGSPSKNDGQLCRENRGGFFAVGGSEKELRRNLVKLAQRGGRSSPTLEGLSVRFVCRTLTQPHLGAVRQMGEVGSDQVTVRTYRTDAKCMIKTGRTFGPQRSVPRGAPEAANVAAGQKWLW